MFAKFKGLYELKESIGISVIFASNMAYTFHLSFLKKENDDIDILFNETFQNWNALFNFLKDYKSVPISLQLQGKGVLIKEIFNTEEVSEEFLSNVLPNFDTEDYMSTYFQGTSGSWLSLIRKEVYADVLQKFYLNDCLVLQVFLGPFIADNILELMNECSDSYRFAGHEITVDSASGSWNSYSFNRNPENKVILKIQGLEINENYVISYSLGFSLLLHSYLKDHSIADPIVINQLKEFKEKIKFKVNSLFFLCILLFLLLVNAFLFGAYRSKFEMISSKSNSVNFSKGELEKLKKESSRNDSLLLELGWNSGIKKSWLINQLMSSLQENDGLQIQSVDINPKLERIVVRARGELENPYIIKISGSSYSLNHLESWVRELRGLPWVKQVEINRFVSRNDPKSDLMDFMLNLEYSGEF